MHITTHELMNRTNTSYKNEVETKDNMLSFSANNTSSDHQTMIPTAVLLKATITFCNDGLVHFFIAFDAFMAFMAFMAVIAFMAFMAALTLPSWLLPL